MTNFEEKKITVGIDIKDKNYKHKAKHAMSAFRQQILKHFRTTNCVISKNLNEFFWAKGRPNAPSKVSIIGITKNNKIYLFLDTPEDLKNKDILIKGKEEKKETKPSKDLELKTESKDLNVEKSKPSKPAKKVETNEKKNETKK